MRYRKAGPELKDIPACALPAATLGYESSQGKESPASTSSRHLLSQGHQELSAWLRHPGERMTQLFECTCIFAVGRLSASQIRLFLAVKEGVERNFQSSSELF